MPLAYEITFRPGGHTEEFAGCTCNSYELDDGFYLEMRTAPIWCRRCRKITHGEEIATLDEIDQRLADLANPDSRYYQDIARGYLHKTTGGGDENLRKCIQLWKRRRLWRETRSSPPKCVVCGSVDIFVFPIGKGVSHPGGLGLVLFDVIGFASTKDQECVFTPEGDRTTRAKRPDSARVQALHDYEQHFYAALGPEDTAQSCRHEGCNRGVVRFSVFCKKHHFESVMSKACPFSD